MLVRKQTAAAQAKPLVSLQESGLSVAKTSSVLREEYNLDIYAKCPEF